MTDSMVLALREFLENHQRGRRGRSHCTYYWRKERKPRGVSRGHVRLATAPSKPIDSLFPNHLLPVNHSRTGLVSPLGGVGIFAFRAEQVLAGFRTLHLHLASSLDFLR